MKHLTLILLFNFSILGFSQDYTEYYLSMNKADSLLYFEQVEEALEYYKIALNSDRYHYVEDLAKGAKCASGIDSMELAFKWYQEMAQQRELGDLDRLDKKFKKSIYKIFYKFI